MRLFAAPAVAGPGVQAPLDVAPAVAAPAQPDNVTFGLSPFQLGVAHDEPVAFRWVNFYQEALACRNDELFM